MCNYIKKTSIKKIYEIFFNFFNYIILGFLVFLCLLGTFFKQVSFGLGLGDFIGYLVLYITTLAYLILTLILRKKRTKILFPISIIFFFLTIMICLKATIWRGSEYRWNGQLFYIPCLKEILIKKENFQETVAVSMCTGYYNSKILGKWNGNQFKVIKGNVEYPKEIKKYINLPIKLINIEKMNEGVYGNSFVKDTMKINMEYNIEGEVSKIVYGIPTIKLE